MTRASTEDGRFNHDERVLPDSLLARQLRLQRKFLQEAEVVDAQTGFIRVAFMNRQPDIDKEMLKTQADILSWIFRDTYPTRIIGIPQSGLPLAMEVSKKFPSTKYIRSRKDNGVTSPSWPEEETFSVYSFTQQTNMTMHTEPIESGERYLVVDDVIAYGHAGSEFIRAIHERGGKVVGLAAGWDKAFQGGLRHIANDRHVPVASVVSVAHILPNKSISLSHLFG